MPSYELQPLFLHAYKHRHSIDSCLPSSVVFLNSWSCHTPFLENKSSVECLWINISESQGEAFDLIGKTYFQLRRHLKLFGIHPTCSNENLFHLPVKKDKNEEFRVFVADGSQGWT